MVKRPRNQWRLGLDQVGPRGLALLAAVAILGLGLGVHGYGASQKAASDGLAPVGGRQGIRSTPATAATPASSPNPTPSPSPAAQRGPKLADSQYAPYAFQIYPGPLDQGTRQALAGFHITVQSVSGGLEVLVQVLGSSQPPFRQTYSGAARIYFIEANMGDDSGNSEFNLGDDGLIATDAQGTILK